MAKSTLPKGAVKLINAAVDKVFDRVLARFLERPPVDKRIIIGFKPRVTLPSLFRGAAASERVKADQTILDGLMDVAKGFLDAQRERTKAHTVRAVQSWLSEAHAGGVDTDLDTVLGGELASVFGKAHDGVKRILETESTVARNTGTLDGIIKVNAYSGIEDPIVYFVVVRDGDLCDDCKRLHLLDDETTPRVWYLSELGHGYFKKGGNRPCVGGLHPHCRCSLVTLMPGYGFDGGGMVDFIALDHDEYAKQHGTRKHEFDWGEALFKSTLDGLNRVLPGIKRVIKNNEPWFKAPNRLATRQLFEAPHARTTVNFPTHVANDITNEGRWKNLFETGTGMGSTDTDYRRKWEDEMGIPEDAEATERPVYGGLAWKNEHRHTGAAPMYGDAWATLKPQKHDHISFTPYDSSRLSDRDDTHYLPLYGHEHADKLIDHHIRDAKSRYIEAQIHGGVYPGEDIESLHVPQHQVDPESMNDDAMYYTKKNQEHIDNVLPMAKHYGLPLYGHTSRRSTAAGSYGHKVYDAKLLHDPRLPHEQRHHEQWRNKILDDMGKVRARAVEEMPELGSDTGNMRYNQLRDLVGHIDAGSDQVNAQYNQHTVHGHQVAVAKARELYPNTFPGLGPNGEVPAPVDPQMSFTFPEPAAAVPGKPSPASARPRTKKPRSAAPASGSPTSRKPRAAKKGPVPGSPPASTTP